MKLLKDKILYCLEKYPDSRNSDIKLTNAIWVEFYRENLFLTYDKIETGELAVKLTDLYELPREDHVKRVRAIIQNVENKFLPTSWEDAKLGEEQKLLRLKLCEFYKLKNFLIDTYRKGIDEGRKRERIDLARYIKDKNSK